ncbi:MAG: hypothetical protein HY782_01405 [Chloroflexi bacterium]|nr:hypothetical protein [Chloroflexota bacterium]
MIAGQDYADLASYQRRIEILRRMTGEQRLALAFDMWKTARETTRAGIRAQHPNFSPEAVDREVARRIMIANGAARVIASRG